MRNRLQSNFGNVGHIYICHLEEFIINFNFEMIVIDISLYDFY